MKKSRKFLAVVVLVVLAMLVVAPGLASAAPATSPGSAPASGSSVCWYQVKWGDTLSSIAARYGVSTTYLQQINGIANRNFIWAGQWLRVPCGYAYNWYPYRHYYYSTYYGCWGYSYWNSYYGRNIFICTG